MQITFIDTETTGFPKRGVTLDKQPWVLQLGLITTNEWLRPMFTYCAVIDIPQDAEIPEAAAEIHGIRRIHLDEFGVSPRSITNFYCQVVARADLVVMHNLSYDTTMMKIMAERFGLDVPNFNSLCTMLTATDVLELPGRYPGKYKWPKLEEAFKYFVGADMPGAHDALADVRGTIEVFRGLLDAGVVDLDKYKRSTK